MGIIHFAHSDIGKVRQNNEDSFHANADHNFFIVADGMGGHLGGEVASRLAIETVSSYIQENHNVESNPKSLIEKAILKANQIIYDHACKNEKVQGMGTTTLVALFKDSTLYIGNVGDSRCYLINNKLIYQLTRDHSLVQEKVYLGIYSREDGVKDPMKNVLIRTVGFEPQLSVDVFHYKVNKNDLFLLCSDGIYGLVSDSDLVHLINKNIPHPEQAEQGTIESTVHQIIEQALKNGGSDNATAILLLAQEK